MKAYKPVALIILDGWGIREMAHGNAVVQADTPNYNDWLRTWERSILDASGEAVGLPRDQMGNSEVGHLNLGAGRIVYQDITRINLAIEEGKFYQHEMLAQAISNIKETDNQLHLIGLLGSGGVHSLSAHLYALLDLAQRNDIQAIVHVITDGRDTPPTSGLGFVQELEAYLDQCQCGRIASVSGRYYAMDRDKRWDRTKKAYRAIVLHEAEREAPSASEAVARSYEEGVTDEFIVPTIIGDDGHLAMGNGDAVIFFNFRADRMRQLVQAIAVDKFDGFEREYVVQDPFLLTMTQYMQGLPVNVLFEGVDVKNPVAAVISAAGCAQYHAAETEKYAHVTYFFNGGRETPFPGEDRCLIPSPKVATYDLKPEMSANELAAAVEERLKNKDDDFILVNFANPDMVGHTGDLQAAIKAIEAVDECAGRLVDAVVAKGGVALVTADHGNAEIMIDELTGEPHTYHTTNPVSFFAIGEDYWRLYPRGILADVAPTVLDLLGLEKPDEMTGRSLIDRGAATPT